MNNYNQLKLFTPELPEWKNITIEWLYDYLTFLYPEMKFKLIEKENYFDKNKYFSIEQTAYKKVELQFSLGEYAQCVTTCKNRNYISCSSMKLYGSYAGHGETYDNMEDFIKSVPLRIQRCKENAMEYKNKKTDVN